MSTENYDTDLIVDMSKEDKYTITDDNFKIYIDKKIADIDSKLIQYDYEYNKNFYLNYSLTLPQIVINALMTGTALLEQNDYTKLKEIIGIAGITNVVFQSLSTSLNYSDKARKFKELIKKNKELKNELEFCLLMSNISNDHKTYIINKFYKNTVKK